MKCQILFSGKNKKKDISICSLPKLLPRVLSVTVLKKLLQTNFYFSDLLFFRENKNFM